MIISSTTERAVGDRLLDALATSDFDAARGLLDDDVEFVAVTPAGVFQAAEADTTIGILSNWYPQGGVDGLEIRASEPFHSRHRLSFRVTWRDPRDRALVFEQHAYYDTKDGQIVRVHLVCSGDHPVQPVV